MVLQLDDDFKRTGKEIRMMETIFDGLKPIQCINVPTVLNVTDQENKESNIHNGTEKK